MSIVGHYHIVQRIITVQSGYKVNQYIISFLKIRVKANKVSLTSIWYTGKCYLIQCNIPYYFATTIIVEVGIYFSLKQETALHHI